MGEETVEKVLKDFGLTKSEAEVYVFLANRGVLKSGEVARQIRKDKAQVLRILKSLQSKGLVESTLEAPTRFTVVPFEKVLDLFVKAKRDEAAYIEQAKEDLLTDWKTLSRARPEPPLEKFVVIEGINKIYAKIFQMINETKSQLSAISTIPSLVRADQLGVLDALFNHPLRARIKVRFLTEPSGQNSNAVNAFLEEASKAGINFKRRNPQLGLKLSPRMIMRDNEEVLLFITPKTQEESTEQFITGLWTNCKTLVQTFVAVFEDSWHNGTDSQHEMVDIEKGRSPPKTFIMSKAETLLGKHEEIMNSAKEEITFLTSSQGLIELWKNMTKLRDWTERGVSIRIMAPTTVENLNAVQQLSKYCQVRHAPESRLKVTVVDGTHVFQFKNTISDKDESDYAFYSSDSEHVAKMKAVLNDVWKNAQAPSAITLESILNPPTSSVDPFRNVKGSGPYTKGSVRIEEYAQGTITEKDVLNKILNAKRIIAKDPRKDVNTLCGSNAYAVIHPPEHFNLPDMIITVWHCDKQSSWGAEDWLTVSLWLKTPIGFRYAPVAHVTDNPDALEFRKGVYAGTPAGQNCQLVNKDQFQVQVHGNTLFSGWTIPIPLFPPPFVLPPSCILFEGYGELRTTVTKTRIPCGRTQVTEANHFDAFVTFFHPASKYSGPGTDGIFNRDMFFTAYPPA